MSECERVLRAVAAQRCTQPNQVREGEKRMVHIWHGGILVDWDGEPEEEPHGLNCICDSCLQIYPERGVIAGLYDMNGEPYDEEPRSQSPEESNE